MDRSFLSDAAVIAASRQFVCIRLATYEDEDEAKLLKGVFTGKSGELENTVFAILTPDGQKKLMKASRSPKQLFADAPALAKALNGIAQKYPGKKAARTLPLPLVANVRLALDVAACDNQPLVIVCAKDAGARAALQQKLAGLVWSDEFIGRYIFVSAGSTEELAAVPDIPDKDGIIVVQPDQYGLKGKVLANCGAGASVAEIAALLKSGASQYQPSAKTFHSHVQAGKKLGVFWETTLPVTDPMEEMARQSNKGYKKTK
jgi:hypothetical protein